MCVHQKSKQFAKYLLEGLIRNKVENEAPEIDSEVQAQATVCRNFLGERTFCHNQRAFPFLCVYVNGVHGVCGVEESGSCVCVCVHACVVVRVCLYLCVGDVMCFFFFQNQGLPSVMMNCKVASSQFIVSGSRGTSRPASTSSISLQKSKDSKHKRGKYIKCRQG